MRIGMGVPDRLDSDDWNGFRTAFRDINAALDEHERIVFAPSGGDINLDGGNEDPAQPVNKYHNTIAASKDFAAKVGQAKPDAIVAFNSMGLFLSEKFIYYTSNVPYKKIVELVEGEYPDTEHFRKLTGYYRFVAERERENYEKAEKIIVLSHKIKQHIIEEHGINAGKIAYVPRPIPKMYGSKARKKGRMRIIFMPAELRVMKGIRYAIETMKVLKEKMPNAILVITGRINYYEKDYMKELLDGAKGKANIVVAGFVPRKQFESYMGMADCAFMPFCFDECPVSLSECIGHGLPVVTNEYAGFEKEVINSFGHCANYKDINDYAEKLMEILSDDELREEKSDGARKVTDRFSFDLYKKEINNAFEEFGEA